MDNIILIGYMGCGKSSVMKVFNTKYSMEAYDTDDVIEQMQGISISDIFETKGEDYFRELETEVLKNLLNSKSNAVIATGGGLPIYNKDILFKEEKVVYLKASTDVIVKRLVNDTSRPLIAGKSNDEKELALKVNDMLKERGPIYEEVADVIINVDDITPERIVKKIFSVIDDDY